MMKRLMAFGMCLLCCVYSLPVRAEDEPDMTALEAAAKVDEGIPARSAILVEQQTGQVLYEKNADEVLPPASVTKIMTLLLTMQALEQGKLDLDQQVACSAHAASMGGSQIWLEEGEALTVDDLLKATAISSANDASVVLAEAVAGSEEAFVDMMNDQAAALGMENTHFVNATGLDAEGHVTTARDIAAMSCALLRYPLIRQYTSVWMSELRDGKTQLVNTNKLVRFYDGCDGLKTGTTDGAGSCLAASATKKGMSLVAVTLGSPTSEERFSAARGLLDYGFANYTRLELPEPEGLEPVRVRGGVQQQVEVECRMPEAVIVRTADKGDVTQQVQLAEDVQAPVEQGQALGTVTVQVGDSVICEYSLVAACAVEKMTFGKALAKLFESLAAC